MKKLLLVFVMLTGIANEATSKLKNKTLFDSMSNFYSESNANFF